MRFIVLPLLLSAIFNTVYSQSEIPQPFGPQPEIGKPMPDFKLHNVTHYRKKEASLTDFRNKWLFLDFWFTGCTACIKSFPKINTLQEQFKDKAQFMLIGVNKEKYFHGKNIEVFYEKLRKKQNLNIAVAYDSILNLKWGIWSMPHIIIVNPEGQVVAITGGVDLTAEKIQKLIEGKPVSFYPKSERIDFDPDRLLFSEKSKEFSDNLLYRSILTKWSGETANAGDLNMYVKSYPEFQKEGFKTVGVSLKVLYKQAYIGQGSWSLGAYLYTKDMKKMVGSEFWSLSDSLYGRVYPEPILEISDTSMFQEDFTKHTGYYNYCLNVPLEKVTREYLMRIVQNDLKNVFGHEVVIERRNVPVWSLVAKIGTEEKLSTKGGEPYVTKGSSAAGFSARNISIEKALGKIVYYISDKQPPFIDETGIEANIDITLDADMTKLFEVKKVLQENGLDLVKTQKSMMVLVIKDPKS